MLFDPSDLFMPQTIFPIELKVDSLLCLESFIVLLVPLFVAMHLIADLLMFVLVTTTLMWLISVVVTKDLMLLESIVMIVEVMWSKFALNGATLMLDHSDPLIFI